MENRRKAYISVAESGDPPQTLAGGIKNPVTNDEETPEGGSSISLHRKVTLHGYKSKAADISSL